MLDKLSSQLVVLGDFGLVVVVLIEKVNLVLTGILRREDREWLVLRFGVDFLIRIFYILSILLL